MKKLGIQQENVKQKRKLVTSSVVLRKLKPEEIEKFKRGRLEKCRHCPKKLKTANSLKTHMKKFHSCLGCFQPKLPKKNLCQSCHAKLNVYVSLPKISDDSGKRKGVKNDYRKFIQPDLNLVPKSGHCLYCNTFKEDLKNHLEKPNLNCHKCNAVVSKKFCLLWHKSRAHDDEQNSKTCVQCNITFPTNDNLDLHMFLVH